MTDPSSRFFPQPIRHGTCPGVEDSVEAFVKNLKSFQVLSMVVLSFGVAGACACNRDKATPERSQPSSTDARDREALTRSGGGSQATAAGGGRKGGVD